MFGNIELSASSIMYDYNNYQSGKKDYSVKIVKFLQDGKQLAITIKGKIVNEPKESPYGGYDFMFRPESVKEMKQLSTLANYFDHLIFPKEFNISDFLVEKDFISIKMKTDSNGALKVGGNAFTMKKKKLEANVKKGDLVTITFEPIMYFSLEFKNGGISCNPKFINS